MFIWLETDLGGASNWATGKWVLFLWAGSVIRLSGTQLVSVYTTALDSHCAAYPREAFEHAGDGVFFCCCFLVLSSCSERIPLGPPAVYREVCSGKLSYIHAVCSFLKACCCAAYIFTEDTTVLLYFHVHVHVQQPNPQGPRLPAPSYKARLTCWRRHIHLSQPALGATGQALYTSPVSSTDHTNAD